MQDTATRSISFVSGDLTLEGAIHLPEATPAPGVVVCHPHPQYGGDMDNNVVMAACHSLARAGIAALRFNTRGTGRSEGAFDNGDGERDDLRAALEHLAALDEVDGKRVGLVGYSFGAMIAAEVASGDLRALTLISPPLAFGDVKVAWGCPALVLGGDSDSTAPADRLAVLADAPGVELRILEGVDHSWWGFEDELGSRIATFFEQHLR